MMMCIVFLLSIYLDNAKCLLIRAFLWTRMARNATFPFGFFLYIYLLFVLNAMYANEKIHRGGLKFTAR